MPGAHRDTDSRFCGGQTGVVNQSTVYVEDLLWAVNGDPQQPGNHGGSPLSAITGSMDVYVEDKLVITAIGDIAAPCNFFHPLPPTDPSGRSTTVFAYD